MAERKYTAAELAAMRSTLAKDGALVDLAEIEGQEIYDRYDKGGIVATNYNDDPYLYDSYYESRHLRNPERSNEADTFWKGLGSFGAGTLMGFAAAEFGTHITKHLVKASGQVLGQSLGSLVNISAGVAVASMAPEGWYGLGMLSGSITSMLPTLLDPPTIGGLIDDAIDLAGEMASDVGQQLLYGDSIAPQVLPYGVPRFQPRSVADWYADEFARVYDNYIRPGPLSGY